MLQSLPEEIVSYVISLLPQNDVLSLTVVSKAFSKLASSKLFESISISRTPVMRSSMWYIDSHWTNLSGESALTEYNNDQSDYRLYLKVSFLIRSIKENASLGGLIERVHIYDSVFHSDDDQNYELLNELVDTLDEFAGNLKSIVIDDSRVKRLTKNSLLSLDTSHWKDAHSGLKSLRMYVPRYTNDSIPESLSLPHLESLTIHDFEHASLRLIPIFKNLKSLKRLSFNHIHGLHDYNTPLRDLTTIPLENFPLNQITHLELTIGCQEPGCECLSEFFTSLAPKLTSLTHFAVQESTYLHDHYLTESFDLAVCQFLLAVKTQLKYLCIRHNPPLNGLKLPNNVEGNYLRRRTLYSKTLPQLTSLRTLIAPTFLGTCACYEILVSDLLWNGCECSHCSPVHEKFDKYLMDHQYYDTEEAEFKDMLTCQLFGIMSRELLKKFPNLINEGDKGACLSGVGELDVDSLTSWSDLDWLSTAPRETKWDFHQGYDSITCFEDLQSCGVDEGDFDDLSICIAHFLKGYVDWMIVECPSLREIVLNGIFFDKDVCVYE